MLLDPIVSNETFEKPSSVRLLLQNLVRVVLHVRSCINEYECIWQECVDFLKRESSAAVCLKTEKSLLTPLASSSMIHERRLSYIPFLLEITYILEECILQTVWHIEETRIFFFL